MYCKPPSLKRVKIKRFTILGIDLVSQTNKLKKYRIVRLFKTTNNKILDKIDGKLVTPFPPPPPPPPPPHPPNQRWENQSIIYFNTLRQRAEKLVQNTSVYT